MRSRRVAELCGDQFKHAHAAFRVLSLVAAAAVFFAACGDDEDEGGTGFASGAAKPRPRAAAEPALEQAAIPKLDLAESAFVESEKQRDPFRSFADAFQARLPEKPQRAVMMPDTSMDEMKLIAIVSGIPAPRAMLVDRLGVGHVVRQGDYIGRPEVVRLGGADDLAVTLNWKVERVRAHALVVAREDPTSPEKLPKTRTLALYEGEDNAAN